MSLLLDGLVQGLAFGSIYALAALGFALIFATTRIFHIAYGSLSTVGAYIAVSISSTSIAALGVGLLVAFATVAVLSLLTYRFIYRFMERKGAGQGEIFVASLAIAGTVEAGVVLVFGANERSFGFPELATVRTAGALSFSVLDVIAILGGVAAVAVLLWSLNRTTWGYAVQAYASNPEQAELLGIRTKRLIAQVWVIGALLSVLSAGLLGLKTSVLATGGTQLALYATLAVLAGGIGSYLGAYISALAIGVLGSMLSLYVSGSWGVTGVFAAFLLVLIVAPRGILGGRRTVGERA